MRLELQDQLPCLSAKHLPCHALLTLVVLGTAAEKLQSCLDCVSEMAFDSLWGNLLCHLMKTPIRGQFQ